MRQLTKPAAMAHAASGKTVLHQDRNPQVRRPLPPSSADNRSTGKMTIQCSRFALAYFIFCTGTAFANDHIQCEWEPKELTGCFHSDTDFGFKGTPEIKFRVKNVSDKVVEFPQDRWLVVRLSGWPGTEMFVASPPARATLEPGDEIASLWIIKGGSARAVPGDYDVAVTYKLTGENEWLTYDDKFNLTRHGFDYVVTIVLVCWVIVMLMWSGAFSNVSLRHVCQFLWRAARRWTGGTGQSG